MAGIDLRNVTTPIGMVREFLFEDVGPAWLRLDGKTEYGRDVYPEFVAKAAGLSWFLPGAKASTFKLQKVPAGTSLVASGFETLAGKLIGSDSVTLAAENMPEHDHEFSDATATSAPGKSSVLSGVVPVLSGLTAETLPKRTGKAGQAKPTPVPIKPPGFVVHLFVFAGRPRG